MCTLHDFTCVLLSVTVQVVESTVRDVETKGIPVNLTAFEITRIHIRGNSSVLSVHWYFYQYQASQRMK